MQLTIVQCVLQVHRREHAGEHPTHVRHYRVAPARSADCRWVLREDREGVDHCVDDVGNDIDDEEVGETDDGRAGNEGEYVGERQ